MIISQIAPVFLPILASFLLIAAAELGDKTQIIALGFAARHKMSTVLTSVLTATALLNLLAVVLGKFLTLYLPTSAIKIGAGILFLIFGVWTLVSNNGSEISANDTVHPFWTIFGAFFLAELGDKTQLAVIALAAKYNQPLQIWLGATLGMGLANILGIIIGNKLGTALPQKTIKWIAGLAFITFGVLVLGEVITGS